jgi:hypothetical protein
MILENWTVSGPVEFSEWCWGYQRLLLAQDRILFKNVTSEVALYLLVIKVKLWGIL